MNRRAAEFEAQAVPSAQKPGVASHPTPPQHARTKTRSGQARLHRRGASAAEPDRNTLRELHSPAATGGVVASATDPTSTKPPGPSSRATRAAAIAPSPAAALARAAHAACAGGGARGERGDGRRRVGELLARGSAPSAKRLARHVSDARVRCALQVWGTVQAKKAGLSAPELVSLRRARESSK